MHLNFLEQTLTSIGLNVRTLFCLANSCHRFCYAFCKVWRPRVSQTSKAFHYRNSSFLDNENSNALRSARCYLNRAAVTNFNLKVRADRTQVFGSGFSHLFLESPWVPRNPRNPFRVWQIYYYILILILCDYSIQYHTILPCQPTT